MRPNGKFIPNFNTYGRPKLVEALATAKAVVDTGGPVHSVAAKLDITHTAALRRIESIKNVNPELYAKARAIIDLNKQESLDRARSALVERGKST